jgi:hypothetical protein
MQATVWIMKYRILLAALALTAISWAQTSTQDSPKEPADKASCCAKMAADAKDGHASCMRMHHDAQPGDEKAQAKMDCCAGKDQSKNGMSCCAGKDMKSCAKNGDKASGSCCGDSCAKANDKPAGSCCGDKCDMKGKGCCSDEKKS